MDKFATAVKALGIAGEKVESLAGKILAAIPKDITPDELDTVIVAAYEANGWHTRQGRPSAEKRDKVPHTVRTYMWELRGAVREGLPVWKYDSFYELRIARAKLKKIETPAKREEPKDTPLPDLPELKGVRLASADTPNGALFHDLVLTYTVIPETQRALMARNLERLMHRYQTTVVVKLKKAA